MQNAEWAIQSFVLVIVMLLAGCGWKVGFWLLAFASSFW
jgi:hypothetical protein